MEKLDELVIGRKYRLKPAEWFKTNRPDDYYHRKAICDAGKEVTLIDIENENQLVFIFGWNYNRSLWLKIDAVEEIIGQPNPSRGIIEAINKLRNEEFINGYDGGPGGGAEKVIDTRKEPVLPAFGKDGNEGIFIKVCGLRRTFELSSVEELFEKGSTKQGFQATEHTYISTSLTLVKDKNKLPKETSWSTMKD
jgi:hypothetical protein